MQTASITSPGILARSQAPTNRPGRGPLDDVVRPGENPGVHTISVESGFRATHHVRLPGGGLETPHPHDWKVRVFLSRPELDDLGMVADFEGIQRTLAQVLLGFQHADLNTCAAFAGVNPTAEVLAKFIFERLGECGLADLRRVEVTEAPGCVASYEAR